MSATCRKLVELEHYTTTSQFFNEQQYKTQRLTPMLIFQLNFLWEIVQFYGQLKPTSGIKLERSLKILFVLADLRLLHLTKTIKL